MSRFLQLHVLTHYPPSNLNRDDTGRPKTALVGEATRLRVSSQSLKRAWRTSDAFRDAMTGHIGQRTKRIGREVHDVLIAGGIDAKSARDWSKAIAERFGKLKVAKPEKADKADKTDKADKADKKVDRETDLETEQLVHLSPEEREAVDALTQVLLARRSAPEADELKLLSHPRRAVDIAMFGRMLADSDMSVFNVEAAVQVAHAYTVHKAEVEDDYFSAVDDISRPAEADTAHIDERGYGAGLYYLYLSIDRSLLRKNLGDDDALCQRALRALVDAVTRVSPTGMQNSFASRAYAGYVLAEKGDQQPRSLSQAFLKPVRDRDGRGPFDLAVAALETRCNNFDAVYGPCADARLSVNVEVPSGTMAALADFVAG